MNDDGDRNQQHDTDPGRLPVARGSGVPRHRPPSRRRALPAGEPGPAACAYSEHAEAAATFLHRNAPNPMR